MRGNHRIGSSPQSDIVIGLVNIMPLAAVRNTENLFRRLLSLTPLHSIQLRLFAPQAMPARTDEIFGAEQYYESLDDLWNAHAGCTKVDALIVTGTESQASRMEDEPAWPHVQKICDWAARHTVSTIWSCFSAHAAVRHLDGVPRHRLAQKCSGVFECESVAGHVLSRDLPARFTVPHSRHHGLAKEALQEKHYRILSHSADAGVDSFTKRHGDSQFLFLQGHPEYTPKILFNEYIRDAKRFFAGERASCPEIPENYFDAASIAALRAVRRGDKPLPDGLSLQELANSALSKLGHPWAGSAQQLINAWIGHIAAQKFRNWTHDFAYENEPAAAR